MARFTYSAAMLKWLEIQYQTQTARDITPLFNKKYRLKKTVGAIKSAITQNGIRCRNNKKRDGKPTVYTPAQLVWTAKAYKTRTLAELTAAFNKKYNDTKKISQIRGLTRNYKMQSGRTGQFEKGHASWSKGTRGLLKPNAGSFKKGHTPANVLPLGTERTCKKDGFILTKVKHPAPDKPGENCYQHKHVYVWEKAHGPVPPGFVVSFIDGDKTKVELDNLEMISRQELLQMNRRGFSDCPDHLKPMLRTLAKLEAKTFQRARQK